MRSKHAQSYTYNRKDARPAGSMLGIAVFIILLLVGFAYIYTSSGLFDEKVKAVDYTSAAATSYNQDIVIYSLSSCKPCAHLRRDLIASETPYVEYFVDKDPMRKEELDRRVGQMMARDGYAHTGVPMIFAGHKVFVGIPPVKLINKSFGNMPRGASK